MGRWRHAHSRQGDSRASGSGVSVVLLGAPAGDPEYQAWVGAFLQTLQELGWIDGHNVRIDTRWATVNPAGIRKQAAELAALAPDVILAPGTSNP